MNVTSCFNAKVFLACTHELAAAVARHRAQGTGRDPADYANNNNSQKEKKEKRKNPSSELQEIPGPPSHLVMPEAVSPRMTLISSLPTAHRPACLLKTT